MGIEIEKKYRLTKKQRQEVLLRLPQVGANRLGENFEVNTLYAGENLDVDRSVLRLRRIGNRGILTYKERFPTRSDIKHQREDETPLDNPDAMEAILDAIGFAPVLIYEKRRETWRMGESEIVIDELPFGLFMEIEGPEKEIRDIERKLAIKGLKAETATYPQLAHKHGTDFGGVIEACFPENK
jgi:adenylate cyclase class 2